MSEVETLSGLAAILAQAGNTDAERLFNEASERADKILPEHLRGYIQQTLATDLATAQYVAKALSTLGPRPIDEFVRLLAGWSSCTRADQAWIDHFGAPRNNANRRLGAL